MFCEGEHVRIAFTPRDSKGLTKELVSQVFSSLRKIGCRCVLDEMIRDKCRSNPAHIDCINRFEPLMIVHVGMSILIAYMLM